MIWYVSHGKPTDHIFLSQKDDECLCELWKKGFSTEKGFIPSDLFFAETVPLLDCMITVDESHIPGGKEFEYRVTIFPDYKERISQTVKSPNGAYVGAVSWAVGNEDFGYSPLIVKYGLDRLGIGGTGYSSEGLRIAMEDAYKNYSMQYFCERVFALMSTWYGIQIALLHPMVRDVFARPTDEKVILEEPNKGGGKRRVVRYVKKHVVNADKIRKKLVTNDGKFSRHTLCWYVIGHWRNSSNGEKTFIQPYWKGPMRALKMDQEGREREIVMEKVKA